MKTPSILERFARHPKWDTPGVCSLIVREGSAAEIANCLELEQSFRPALFEECRGVLPEIWRTLLRSGGMQLLFFESRVKPFGSRIVSFSGPVSRGLIKEPQASEGPAA